MGEPYKMSRGEKIFVVGMFTALMLTGSAVIYTAFKINQYADMLKSVQEYTLELTEPH